MRKLGRVLLWVLGIVAVIALLARAVLFNVWTVHDDDPRFTASLAPTLRAGDITLVMKRGAFGFGSLVRCTDPNDVKRFVAARIAGLPGDHLEIEGRLLSVNGRAYNGESACPNPTYTVLHPTSGEGIVLHCDKVSMGGGWHYRSYGRKPLFASPRAIATVGEGMVFLVSDDRDYHYDSRDFGAVPRSSCKGPIVFRLWGKDGFLADRTRFEVLH